MDMKSILNLNRNHNNNHNNNNNFDPVVVDDIHNNGICCTKLTKFYGKFPAVNSLSINVNPGDIYGFLGPNGAGKTTTIRMLCGLLLPTSGNGKVAGLDIVNDRRKIRRLIGLLPESAGFYNWMNSEEYLFYFARLYKIEHSIAKIRVRDLLEKVGLADKLFVPIGYFSRGMKQRLGLARTLINDPKIVFLDEPTLGLDPRGQQDIQKILLDLNHEKNVTVFLSSHALSEVSSLCNRIAVVNKGMRVAQGSIEELGELVENSSFSPKYGILVRILRTDIDTSKVIAKIRNLQIPTKINSQKNDRIIDVFVSVESKVATINKIMDIFDKAELQIYEVRRIDLNLEEIFFKLIEKNDESLSPPVLESKIKK
jgi:ABC-2 type transport system ATP-binding protein